MGRDGLSDSLALSRGKESPENMSVRGEGHSTSGNRLLLWVGTSIESGRGGVSQEEGGKSGRLYVRLARRVRKSWEEAGPRDAKEIRRIKTGDPK